MLYGSKPPISGLKTFLKCSQTMYSLNHLKPVGFQSSYHKYLSFFFKKKTSKNIKKHSLMAPTSPRGPSPPATNLFRAKRRFLLRGALGVVSGKLWTSVASAAVAALGLFGGVF